MDAQAVGADVVVAGFATGPLIHQTSRHRVFRATRLSDGLAVVIKATHPGAAAEAISALRHEHETLKDLDVPGVVRSLALVRVGDGVGAVLEDAGPRTLEDLLAEAPPGLGTALAIGVSLASILDRIHHRRVVHRDLNPANLVLGNGAGQLTLIDFEQATNLRSIPPADSSPWAIKGALPYIAPEQTGRTGRSVDSRTDLYSAGAILYELFTGSPPFDTTDPVELVHAHMAREPVEPHVRNPRLPPILSEIVLKLLAKSPEDRYQSAHALEADLRTVLARHEAVGWPASFRIAMSDVPRELLVPERLYGREADLAAIRGALYQAFGPERDLVLITGEPGIGKSALAFQASPLLQGGIGNFLTGKFDALKRSEPYAGFTQALRALLRQALGAPETVLAEWRPRLAAALGPNGRVLADVLPEIEDLAGPQPPVPEAGPIEARNRFNLTFLAFIREVARLSRSLVVFLDDLQWADLASIELLVLLAQDPDLPGLQLLGAYRDREVGPDHPLALAIARLGESGVRVRTLHLGPLPLEAVTALCADAVRQEPGNVRPLAALIHRQTGGNPFFIRQVLRSLFDDGLLEFDPGSGAWRWDLAAVAGACLGEVAEHLAQGLNGLPGETRAIVEIAAAVGHHVDLATVAEISGHSRLATARLLRPALEAALLLPIGDAIQLPREAGLLDERLEDLDVTFRFVHDRVQQAAYDLVPESDRPALHLRIGQIIARDHPDQDERFFEFVDHLNRAAPILTPGQRLDLAGNDLAAGRRASAAAAYRTAWDYLENGLALLPLDSWQEVPDLSFLLFKEAAEAAYLAGEIDRAELLSEVALSHAPSARDKGELLRTRVIAASMTQDYAGAIAIGRKGLEELGMGLPATIGPDEIAAEAATVREELGDRPPRSLIDAPEVADEKAAAALGLLSLLCHPAYVAEQRLFPFLALRMAALSLRYGVSEHSAFGFAIYAMVLGAMSGNMAYGHEFGRAAVEVARRFENPGETCKTLHVFANHLNHWKEPLRSDLPLFRQAYLAGLEGGELQFASFASTGLVNQYFPQGARLDEVQVEVRRGLAFAAKTSSRTMLPILVLFGQAIRCLQGLTNGPASLDDGDFQEARFLAESASHLTMQAVYRVVKLQLYYLSGDSRAALEIADAAVPFMGNALGLFTEADHVFYTALALASLLDDEALVAQARERAEARLEECESRLAAWALACPSNFRHKLQLVQAERVRALGRPWEAATLYESAADGARSEGFLQDEALALELAGRFSMARGLRRSGLAYLEAARNLYAEWGAAVKVHALEAAHPSIALSSRELREAPVGRAITSSGGRDLDAQTMARATQALSEELVLDRLLRKLMATVLQASGAERGYLILEEHGMPVVRARSWLNGDISTALERTPAIQVEDLAQSVLQFVRRSKEALILDDAQRDPVSAQDPVVERRGLKSILCMPLGGPAGLVGIVYLENNLISGAFGAERIEFLRLLSTPMAVSLFNAELFTNLEDLYNRAPCGYHSLDINGTVVRMNDTELSWLGYSREEVLGKTRYPDFLGPEGREVFQRNFPVFLDRGWVKDLEIGLVRKDGSTFPALLSATAIRDASGCVVATRSTVYDLSQRKCEEEERARLESREAVARAELEAAHQVEMLKTDFVNAVSHDLRIPLTSIIGYAEFLEDGLAGPLNSAQAEFVEQIQGASRRLEGLVNDLLEFARIGAGTFMLELGTADVVETVREIGESLRPQANRAELALSLELPTTPIEIRMDSRRIGRAVGNLVQNALKFTPAGGRIGVAVREEAGSIRCEVSDTGPGIAPENVARLFQRFSQLGTGGAKGGAGLGLSISRTIVEAHGGTIGVASTPGQGSTFWFTLPVEGPDPG